MPNHRPEAIEKSKRNCAGRAIVGGKIFFFQIRFSGLKFEEENSIFGPNIFSIHQHLIIPVGNSPGQCSCLEKTKHHNSLK